jgi:hypothetical protein
VVGDKKERSKWGCIITRDKTVDTVLQSQLSLNWLAPTIGHEIEYPIGHTLNGLLVISSVQRSVGR